MSRLRWIILFALTLAVVWSMPWIAQPISAQSSFRAAPATKIAYRYYPIAGTTATELRSQMNRLGPSDETEGRRYDARTDWVVQWNYRYRQQSRTCTLQQAQTQVAVTFTLPQWQPPRWTARSLVQDWRRYQASLQLHEDGHKNHGIGAAQDIQQALRQLPPAASCAALETQIQTTARAIIRTYNQKDLEYDRVTRHGSTQGAIFPPTTTVSR